MVKATDAEISKAARLLERATELLGWNMAGVTIHDKKEQHLIILGKKAAIRTLVRDLKATKK